MLCIPNPQEPITSNECTSTIQIKYHRMIQVNCNPQEPPELLDFSWNLE